MLPMQQILLIPYPGQDIYDNDGHILTSMSAIAACIKGDIHVTFSDEIIHRAKVIGRIGFLILQDEVQDASKDKLVPLPIGNSSELRVGEQAITIASPFGIPGILTEGVISGLGVLPVRRKSRRKNTR